MNSRINLVGGGVGTHSEDTILALHPNLDLGVEILTQPMSIVDEAQQIPCLPLG